MINKMSIRMKVTAITILLLTTCCIGLTVVLNRSASKMADTLQAASTTDAYTYEEGSLQSPLQGSIDGANMLIPVGDDIYEGGHNALPVQRVEEAKSTYQVSSITYMIVFIMCSGLLTYFIMGKTLRPINELSNQMKNTSVENLSKEIPLSNKKDEIYELTLSFNKMTRKLNEAFLMQKRFSNSAAHELRTPLAVMRTKLDVFKKRKNPSIEDYNNLIESMKNQLTRLSDIVNSLLRLTNMEDIDLSQDIQIKSLMKSVCNDLYSKLENKNIDININGEDANIKGNYDLIYSAFYNLIENSIKYNYENGTVDIRVEQDKEVRVIIKDSGIGIPDDMKEKVFEAFFTVDKSRSRNLGGSGIGLSIVKSVIDNHNGSITIADNKDKGSIFTITFRK